jgi:Cu(I)/Ag(I) efflux system membrane protein CusA/SilA
MYGFEAGAQVMKRIAAPMVGGLVSSTILTLIIIPAIYDIWKRWELKKTAVNIAKPEIRPKEESYKED